MCVRPIAIIVLALALSSAVSGTCQDPHHYKRLKTPLVSAAPSWLGELGQNRNIFLRCTRFAQYDDAIGSDEVHRFLKSFQMSCSRSRQAIDGRIARIGH